MPSIVQWVQSQLELRRLSRRYTLNRNRRSAFVSDAVYVDGEYIRQTPATTGSSTASASASASSMAGSSAGKRKKRLSLMPGLGSSSSSAGTHWRS